MSNHQERREERMAHVPDSTRLVKKAAQQVLTSTVCGPGEARIQPGKSLSYSVRFTTVWNIYRYAFFSVIRILLTVIRIWYAYQKRWYIYHLTSSIRMGVHIAQRCETHTALAFHIDWFFSRNLEEASL